MAKPGMFISKMPSTATPRRASISRSCCASETGASLASSGLAVASSPILVESVGSARDAAAAGLYRGASAVVKNEPEAHPEAPSSRSGQGIGRARLPPSRGRRRLGGSLALPEDLQGPAGRQAWGLPVGSPLRNTIADE